LSEFDNEGFGYDYGDAGEGYVDPSQVSAADMDPTALTNVLQQASAAGAQQALQAAYGQQQQQQAFETAKYASEQVAAAEKILEEIDSTYPTEKRQVVHETAMQHPTLLREESFGHPEMLAEDLARCWEVGSQMRADAANDAKIADDNAAIDRIFEAKRLNWSDRMSRGGYSHPRDVIEGDRR
jgi:hypothetical protein